MITDAKIKELLKVKNNGLFYHRESSDLEFKEQFNKGGLTDYFRTFAAFANNMGGYIVFGVKDSPRKLVGLNVKSFYQFETIDAAHISGELLRFFTPEIKWDSHLTEISGKKIGVFYIHKCDNKPIIATADKDEKIKIADIYYRYGGRTQKIRFTELNQIIQEKIEDQKRGFFNMISKMAKIGSENLAIVNTEKGIMETGNRSLLIDKDLLKGIKVIKEGNLKEKDGAPTLTIVGELTPTDRVNIVKLNLIEQYPFSYMELVDEVKRKLKDGISATGKINNIIKENNIKYNEKYSIHNFRNKKHAENYKKTGAINGAPSIYNMEAVNFIADKLNNP